MTSFFLFLFSLKVAFCSCRTDNKRSGFRSGRSQYAVERLGRMPSAVRESSGLVYRPARRTGRSGTFWTHNDSGGRPTLFELTTDGALVDSIALAGARPALPTNIDWEALTNRDSTTLFIGDIGNNANTRRDLTIYTVQTAPPHRTERISLYYAAQSAFPPTKDTRNFDSEALFFQSDSLFLLSKNRSRPRRPVSLYALPAQPGRYGLLPIDSIFLKSMVTDAGISPDGRTLAVLTYGKIFLFELRNGRVSLSRPQLCLRIPRGQTEALTFVTDTDFVISNERGRMYLVRKK